MEKIIIDSSELVLGRLCTYAAKQAILGKSIEIVNCEKAVIMGTKSSILEKYKTRFSRGTHVKGPFFYRKPDFFVKRVIRGMITYKRGRGKEALKSIKCYIGVPETLSGQKFLTFEDKNVNSRNSLRECPHISVGELCSYFGWKQRINV